MKMNYSQVLEAALALGKRDRLKLREKLTATLDPPAVNGEADDLDGPRLSMDDLTEEEFFAELKRRREEAMRDPSVLIPWEQVCEETDREIRNAARSASPRKRRLRQSV